MLNNKSKSKKPASKKCTMHTLYIHCAYTVDKMSTLKKLHFDSSLKHARRTVQTSINQCSPTTGTDNVYYVTLGMLEKSAQFDSGLMPGTIRACRKCLFRP